MGPGANAEVERILIGNNNPEMLFWDQPLQHTETDAFKNLIIEAQEKVAQLVEENDGPIHVMAHSFGGHLFHQLSLKTPESFLSCSMMATGYDIVNGFYRLLIQVGSHPATESNLKSKITEYLSTNPKPKASELWNYAGLIAQDPAFFRLYWPSEDLFSAFVPYASRSKPMDMQSFQNIINDFVKNYYSPDNPLPSPWDGPVELVLGEKDPLIDIAHESGIWRRIFPQIKIKVLKDSGHFLHLEKILNT
jgi:pimeloyl-ACP methyl ester carboxylesterase